MLIALPVNTFNSGDSNRDLHMLETVRAALFPVLSVRGRIASSGHGVCGRRRGADPFRVNLEEITLF
jgi:hypothetical protein